MGIEACKLQPQTLIHGKIYLHRDANGWAAMHKNASVEFIGYDACPAVVIVRARDGVRQRCQRSLLQSTNQPDEGTN
jgi:hypothetical protein